MQILTGAIVCAASTALAGTFTTEPSYLVPTVDSDFEFVAQLTVGDRVPLTGGQPGEEFALVGIPDAQGVYRDPVTGEIIFFVAHELGNTTLSTPIGGQTPLRGAWISRFVLDADGSVISGGIAHKELFSNSTFVADRPPQQGDTVAFTRFCSGSFAGPAHGMDRPIFFTNEETFGSASYETAKGAQSVAVIDGNMHMLPDLGRVGRETTVVMPRRDQLTAIISAEDAGYPSFVYLYVGTKVRRSADPIEKNGLAGGKTYVLGGRGVDAGRNESSFATGTMLARWIEIPNAKDMTDQQLLTAADALGGFHFTRMEEIEFDPTAPTRTMFMGATGGSGANRLGRLYRVNFNPVDPRADVTLDVIYNADLIVTPGGTYTNSYTGPFLAVNGGPGVSGSYTGFDINHPDARDFPVSVDNISVTRDFIVIQEDRNSPADAVFAKYQRNGGIWTLDRNANFAAKLQATFNYSVVESRDGGASRPAGLWESSGVTDASAVFGAGSFLLNVQAHLQSNLMRTNIPKPGGGTYTSAEARALYTEDGQLLLMRRKTLTVGR